MRLWFCAAALIAAAGAASAAEYPTRPVRLLVQFSPGGNVDTAARAVARGLSERLGQQFVVDNRPGANGSIAYQTLASAPPDGHTLGIGHIGQLALNPHTHQKLPYNPLIDFTAITRVVDASNLVVVNEATKLGTLQELVAYAKANPGKLTYGTSGIGAIGHLTGELLSQRAGIRLVHVPYKGTAPIVPELLAGQLQASIGGPPSFVAHMKTGKLRALAITTLKRSPAFPDIPTIAESGYPGFHAVAWMGIIGPAAMPKTLVVKLNREVHATMNDERTRSTLTALGFELITSTPEAFDAFMRAEHASWGKLLRERGIRAE